MSYRTKPAYNCPYTEPEQQSACMHKMPPSWNALVSTCQPASWYSINPSFCALPYRVKWLYLKKHLEGRMCYEHLCVMTSDNLKQQHTEGWDHTCYQKGSCKGSPPGWPPAHTAKFTSHIKAINMQWNTSYCVPCQRVREGQLKLFLLMQHKNSFAQTQILWHLKACLHRQIHPG